MAALGRDTLEAVPLSGAVLDREAEKLDPTGKFGGRSGGGAAEDGETEGGAEVGAEKEEGKAGEPTAAAIAAASRTEDGAEDEVDAGFLARAMAARERTGAARKDEQRKRAALRQTVVAAGGKEGMFEQWRREHEEALARGELGGAQAGGGGVRRARRRLRGEARSVRPRGKGTGMGPERGRIRCWPWPRRSRFDLWHSRRVDGVSATTRAMAAGVTRVKGVGGGARRPLRFRRSRPSWRRGRWRRITMSECRLLCIMG